MNLKEELQSYTSERKLFDWLGDKTLAEFWEECHNGYWMSIVHLMNENSDWKKAAKAGLECAKVVEHLMNRFSKELLWACEDHLNGDESKYLEDFQHEVYINDPVGDRFLPARGILYVGQIIKRKKPEHLVKACMYFTWMGTVMEIKTAEILREILPPVSDWKIKATN